MTSYYHFINYRYDSDPFYYGGEYDKLMAMNIDTGDEDTDDFSDSNSTDLENDTVSEDDFESEDESCENTNFKFNFERAICFGYSKRHSQRDIYKMIDLVLNCMEIKDTKQYISRQTVRL